MFEFVAGFVSFAAYFAGAIAFCVLFGFDYLRMTPHHEFDNLVREHNASAAVALGGSLIGFAIALAAAIHVTRSAPEFVVWALVAVLSQAIAYFLARLAYPGLSAAIEQNALAAAIWLASVSIAAGLISAACMGA